MKDIVLLSTLIFCSLFILPHLQAQQSINPETKKYISVIKKHILNDYKGMFREPAGILEYPFITPGSDQYSNVLWDWDSWWSNIALRQILLEDGSENERQDALQYEQGCVLNYLNFGSYDGYIPIVIEPGSKKEKFYHLQEFVNNYRSFHRSKETGLYFWQNDEAIGVDNDPCTFYRPPKVAVQFFKKFNVPRASFDGLYC